MKVILKKKVYLVYFGTHSPGIPNNLPVFISIDNEKLIGYGVIE